jgi:hypothetical protein
MKMYGEVEVQIHSFFTSELNGDQQSGSCPGHFTPGERALSTHCIGGWVKSELVWMRRLREKSVALLGIKFR